MSLQGRIAVVTGGGSGIGAAISSGRASRPAGVWPTITRRLSSSLSLNVPVSTWPGATAFTRIPWTISSLATALVKPRIPAFAAE